MTIKPTVSVAMTTYNSDRFVQDQLDSLAKQERLPDELVVSDDCSADRTVDILRAFAATAPFPTRILINDERLGINKNFERAIAATAGDIIFLSDADDYWYPQKILMMQEALDEQPQAGLAVCNADQVDERLQKVGVTTWAGLDRFSPTPRLQRDIAQGRIFLRCMPRGGSCMAFRAKYKPLVLPLPDIGYSYDHFIADSIMCSGAAGAILIPEALLAYRRHAGQVTQGRAPLSKNIYWSVTARRNPPSGLPTLLERIESECADRYCVNPTMRWAVTHHYRARLDMPPSFVGRLRVVMAELITRRYHHFSRGAGSAFKDLFFPRMAVNGKNHTN